jgi:O-antigen/teichoic acid export membrane protein
MGAQALMILAAPALTRLYTPEDFGLLAVYTSLLSIFVVVASLRYELAIPLPKTDIEAANVVVLSLVIVLIMTILSATVVFSIGDRIAEVLDAPDLAKYFWLLPAGVFFAGVYKVFNYWAVRTKNFSLIAKTTVYQALVTLSIQLVGYSLGGVALLIGQAGGRGAGSLKLASTALKNESFCSWNWAGVWCAAKRYKHFPLYSTWSSLLNVTGNQLPPLLFALFFSSNVAGWYLLTQRVLAMPVTLVSGAVSKVFLSNASESLRDGSLGVLITKIHTKLVYMIVPALFVFSLISPELFSFIFGENWEVSGEIARWLSPWLALVFVLSPFMVLFEVLECQKLGLCFQLMMMLLRLGAIVCGYIFDSFLLSVQLFSVVSVVSLLAFNIWVAWATQSNFLEMMKTYIYALLAGALIIAPTVLIFTVSSNAFSKSVGVLFSAVIFVIYAFKSMQYLR